MYVIGFTACYKDTCNVDQVLFPKEKIEKWLDQNKSSDVYARKTSLLQDDNIELLKSNLNFEEATIEQRDEIYDFIILPIHKELSAKKSIHNNALLYLLIQIERKSQDIKWMNIVSYLSSDNKKNINKKTFHNIFNNKSVFDNGVYDFLTVKGVWVYQREYRNGNLYSLGIIAPNINKETARRNPCIDWYLVTTIYYTDGSTDEFRSYIGTTCDDDDGWDYFTVCSDCGGGFNEDDFVEVIDGEDIVEVQDAEEIDDLSLNGANGAPRVKYHHLYTIQRANGEVINVVRSPVTAEPMISSYIDSYNRNITRTLTLFGKWNSWTPLTPTSGLIHWGCNVYWHWSYSGTTKSRQTTHSRTLSY